jgi:protein involved in ribonucleotide reduction
MDLVYFSNVSENTKRFVGKLDVPAHRIPVKDYNDLLEVHEPYILITPTYGGGGRRAVPIQVVRFLNHEPNRSLIRGVIGSGNTNFGPYYGLAARLVADKCDVELLHLFELLGTTEDVDQVRSLLLQTT